MERLTTNAAFACSGFPLGNGTGDPAHVVEALVAIHDAIGRGDQVLVQCAAGSERTGGVIYLYRTLVLGESPDAAYAELLGYGHRPNAQSEARSIPQREHGVLRRAARGTRRRSP